MKTEFEQIPNCPILCHQLGSTGMLTVVFAFAVLLVCYHMFLEWFRIHNRH